MTVSPIELAATSAQAPAKGTTRSGRDKDNAFADALGASRSKSAPSSPKTSTKTPAADAKSADQAGRPGTHTDHSNIAPGDKRQAIEADPKKRDQPEGQAAVAAPVAQPAVPVPPQTASVANADIAVQQTPPGTSGKKSARPGIAGLTLAGANGLNVPGKTDAAQAAIDVGLPEAARIAGAARRASPPAAKPKPKPIADGHRPVSNTTLSATAALTDGAKPGETLIAAADHRAMIAQATSPAMRHFMEKLASAKQIDRTAPSPADTGMPSAHAPAMHAAAPTPGAPSAAPMRPTPATLDMPIGNQAWNDAIARQSLRLHQDGMGRAELRLHPRELGTLQISLQMGDQAQIHISSAHAHVRAAVEAALPQLRQAFADSGIALGDTSVGHQSAQQQHDSNQRRRGAVAPVVGDGGPELAVTPADSANMSIVSRLGPGGIDIFA